MRSTSLDHYHSYFTYVVTCIVDYLRVPSYVPKAKESGIVCIGIRWRKVSQLEDGVTVDGAVSLKGVRIFFVFSDGSSSQVLALLHKTAQCTTGGVSTGMELLE